MEVQSPQDGRGRKPRAWLVAVFIVVVVLAAVGVAAYLGNQGLSCGLACGPPIDVPVILAASVNESTAVGTAANCGIVTQGYPQSVVCQVTLMPGTSGTITMNMTSQNGDSQVAFGTYSSSQYVQFKPSYSCLYSTNPPDYNTLRCPVSGSGSIYKFDYNVSANVLGQTAVLTIVVTKTCCWP